MDAPGYAVVTYSAIFSGLASAFSEAFGGPYQDAVASWPGAIVFDSGGSLDSAGAGTSADCKVQVDVATEEMRMDAGFLATDVRLLVLGLDALGTSAAITITDGVHAGTWKVMSVTRDPAGIGFDCRGRLVA